MLKKAFRRLLESRGKLIVLKSAIDNQTADIPESTRQIYRSVAPYTMTTLERVAALVDSVAYISQSKIPGAIVECGVWRGGSVMAIALTLLRLGDTERDIYLFDTFEGMPDADESRDVDFLSRTATDFLRADRQLPEDEKRKALVLAYCPLEQVRSNVASTGYPQERLHFVKGRVQETIPGQTPDSIALLRLDTDWYESSKHELLHLFPRVSSRGIVILDDYGHWQGVRQATDEYFRETGLACYLHRIDYAGRLILKA